MARKIAKRAEKPVQHFNPKEPKVLVYEIYPRSRKVVYYVRGGQANEVSRITLEGYDTFPSGLFLNKRGFGFGKKGVFLLAALRTHMGKSGPVSLQISSAGRKSIKGTTAVTVTLPHDEVHNLLSRLGRINEDNNNELRRTVASFLSTKFPTRIKVAPGTFDEYQGGEIASILRRSNVAKKLNEEDLKGLRSFFPQIFTTNLTGKKKAARTALMQNAKKTTDKILLDEVIRDFERMLKKGTGEQKWQDFLREKVFPFLSSYVTTIEKQNVSIDVSYPDFVLVDVYNFIDVFEIKKHDTPLLAYDRSHDNYYWRPEVAQAISQIENYIDAVIQNAAEFTKAVRRRKHVDIKVGRPRGYIIAGTSSLLKSEAEVEDFRMLGASLKNITFIMYDELLERLKNLRAAIGTT